MSVDLSNVDPEVLKEAERLLREHPEEFGLDEKPHDVHEHSPLPWRASHASEEHIFCDTKDGSYVACQSTHPSIHEVTRKANVAFIIKAVNHYYELVEACRLAEECLGMTSDSALPGSLRAWEATNEVLCKLGIN